MPRRGLFVYLSVMWRGHLVCRHKTVNGEFLYKEKLCLLLSHIRRETECERVCVAERTGQPVPSNCAPSQELLIKVRHDSIGFKICKYTVRI